jgi:N6-adenosine-specific RNA methylase IME4
MESQRMELPVEQIQVGSRNRKDMGDLDALMASIADLGLLQPIVVRPDHVLVAGERRLLALKRLGWEKIPVVVATGLDDALRLLVAEQDENVCRKDFTVTEKVYLTERLKPLVQAGARKAQENGRRKGGGDRKSKKAAGSVSPNFGESDPARKDRESTRKLAAAVGLSGPTLERAVVVVKAAEQDPERFEPIREQMNRTGKVNGAYKQVSVLVAAAEIAAEPPPLPSGPFRVIAIDPPWQYDSRATDSTHRSANPYPSLSIEEIAALPVGAMAHPEGAVLWLWTTNAHMGEAWNLCSVWGFTPRTILTWVKDRMGTGDWLRGRSEHCVMASRGKPTIVLKNQTTVLEAPSGGHSRKPEEFYALVESLCPGSKVELFARQKREGWVCHGNEV